MRRSLVPISVAFFLLLAGCGDDGYGGDGETVELDADEREAEVAVGDLVEIDLEENASIGDDWRLDPEPDGAVLEFVDESFDLDGEEGCDGCGGTVTFTFEAVGEGETTFTYVNCFRCSNGEPSEPPPDPAELEYTVTVG